MITFIFLVNLMTIGPVTEKFKPATVETNDAIDFIAFYEGYHREAYKCPAGIWTVGHGFTFVNNTPVNENSILELEKSNQLLEEKIMNTVIQINNSIEVPLNANQVTALVSFIFNNGYTAFLNSTLRSTINSRALYAEESEYLDAVEAQFLRWNKAVVNGKKKALPGLTKRRKAEAALFTKAV